MAPVAAAVGFKSFVHVRKACVACGRVELPQGITFFSSGAASRKGKYGRGRMCSKAPVVTATMLLVFHTTVADVGPLFAMNCGLHQRYTWTSIPVERVYLALTPRSARVICITETRHAFHRLRICVEDCALAALD